jgi:hypothetical protein
VKLPKWQDAIFGIGGIIFLVSLIPSLAGDDKPAAVTSLATGLTLYAFLVVHASYKLWIAFGLTFVTASMWMALFFQTIF